MHRYKARISHLPPPSNEYKAGPTRKKCCEVDEHPRGEPIPNQPNDTTSTVRNDNDNEEEDGDFSDSGKEEYFVVADFKWTLFE